MASLNAWGYGKASLVRKSTKEDTEVVVFLPDTHCPHQNQPLVDSALRLIKSVKPHRVVHLGDLSDFHQLSKFNQAMLGLDELQDEIDVSKALLASIRKAAPDAVLDLCEGNHDFRLQRYVAEEARGLRSLKALTYESLFETKAHGFATHPGHGFLLRKNYLVKHGTIVRSQGGASAKAEALSAGVNGISGHVHRAAKWQQTGYQSLEWIEAGTLSLLDPPYVQNIPNWQPGLVVGQFSTKTDSFMTDLVGVMNNKFVFGGKAY